LSGWSF